MKAQLFKWITIFALSLCLIGSPAVVYAAPAQEDVSTNMWVALGGVLVIGIGGGLLLLRSRQK